MRVGIVSNLDERCGNATYARLLQRYLSGFFETRLVSVVPDDWAPDVVILNWHPAKVIFTAEYIKRLQDRGMFVILILQNSFDWQFKVSEANDILKTANALVAHEPMDCDDVEITYIPHGVIDNDQLPFIPLHDDFSIGTAGFAFPWKRTDVVIKACVDYGAKAEIIAAPHAYYNVGASAATWKRALHEGGTQGTIITAWLSEKKVIEHLAKNHINIFWFENQDVHDSYGQTGSARLGVAAERPMIISTHRKFRTILPYEDEFYIAKTESDVYLLVAEIKEAYENEKPLKRPKRILQEQGWHTCAGMYKDLIEKVAHDIIANNAT